MYTNRERCEDVIRNYGMFLTYAQALSDWCFLLRFVALHLYFHLPYNPIKF